jgi:hypothetical protein
VVAALIFLAALAVEQQSYFERYAAQYGIDPVLLEGICRYESDSGRRLRYKNKNGTWDVGFCMNHRPRSKQPPRIPSRRASIKEAARELAYWKRQHNRFCVHRYRKTGTCGSYKYGKWRGVKNCWRPHAWWGHYNWGFRVSKRRYDKKVKCFIDNGFKKCRKRQWRSTKF